MSTLDSAKLIRIYIKMRDVKKEITDRHKDELADITGKMNTISTELKKRILATGGDGIKSKEFGTASITETIKAGCSDWGEFTRFLKENEHDPLIFLSKSLKSEAIKQYMDDNEGNLPPGVNIFKESKVSIRKPSKT